MRTDFDSCFKAVLGHEGGYVNDPNDRGGETYKGIARKFHGDWPGWMIIDLKKDDRGFPASLDTDAVLQDHVKTFYRIRFWDKMRCNDLPEEIRYEMFDTGVNQGVDQAIRVLQRSLNLLNQNGRLWADVAVDGVIGSVTLQIARGCAYKKALHNTMNVLQGMRYVEICERDRSQEAFFRGWITNRVQWIP
jgi:lysozyme family protein